MVLAVNSAVVEKVSLAIPEELAVGWSVPVALLAYMQQDRREDGTPLILVKLLGLTCGLAKVEYRTQPLVACQCQALELFAEGVRAEIIVTAKTRANHTAPMVKICAGVAE
jgi:hypothetical protein